MIPRTIKIGYVGEQYSRDVDIDISSLLELFPNTTPHLFHKRSGEDTPYPVVTELNGNVLHWVFTPGDARKKGYGEAQISFINENGTTIGKSSVFKTVVLRSLDENPIDDIPAQAWVQQVIKAAADIKSAEEDVIKAQTAAIAAEGYAETAQSAANEAISASERTIEAIDNIEDYLDSINDAKLEINGLISTAADYKTQINTDIQTIDQKISAANATIDNANAAALRAVDAAESVDTNVLEIRQKTQQVEQLASDAASSASRAATSERNANTSESNAQNYANIAEAHKNGALLAADEAREQASDAHTFAVSASEYADRAQASYLDVSRKAEEIIASVDGVEEKIQQAQSTIREAISEANSANEETKGIRDSVAGIEASIAEYERSAVSAKDLAVSSASDASAQASSAATSAREATLAKTDAVAANQSAVAAKDEAKDYADRAQAAAESERHVVVVQNEQPTFEDNKLWIKEQEMETILVPTYSQFEELAEEVHNKVETDPTVPAWAKAPSKPVYTASEIKYGEGTVQNEIDTLKEDLSQKYRTSENQDAIDNSLSQRIDAIETAKFPNAVFIGEPMIVGDTVSRFSNEDYMIFPFMVDVRNKPFSIEFAFSTGADVTNQQNILDSHFGLALAIQNSRGIMALSSNGESWDIGLVTGTMTILPNANYYARISWDGSAYTGSLSTDGTTYVNDMYAASTVGLFPQTMYIGGAPNLFGSNSAHPFSGTIDMGHSRLIVAGLEVWHGMDDPGLASRANVSLSNLDTLGEERFKADNLPYNDTTVASELSDLGQDVSLLKEDIASKQDKIDDLDSIRDGAEKGATALQSVPMAGTALGGIYSSGNRGVTVANGKIDINRATDAEVDAKSQNYKPIVPASVERAVRAGLISNSQITDADKADICRTIGAAKESDFELIESITLSSEQDSIVRTAYPDGTPYRLKNAMVFVQIPGENRSGTNIPRVRGLLNGNPLGYINAKTIYSNTMYCYWAIDIFNKNYMIQSFSGDYNDTIAPSFGRWPNNIGSDYIDGIEVFMYTTVGTKYPVGTKIDIYGVKA